MADPEVAEAVAAVDVLADTPDENLTEAQIHLLELKTLNSLLGRACDALERLAKCQEKAQQPLREAPNAPIFAVGPKAKK